MPGSGSWSTSWRRVRMSGGAGCSLASQDGPRPARRESVPVRGRPQSRQRTRRRPSGVPSSAAEPGGTGRPTAPAAPGSGSGKASGVSTPRSCQYGSVTARGGVRAQVRSRCRSSASSRVRAAMMSERWVNAWGRLPSCSPLGRGRSRTGAGTPGRSARCRVPSARCGRGVPVGRPAGADRGHPVEELSDAVGCREPGDDDRGVGVLELLARVRAAFGCRPEVAAAVVVEQCGEDAGRVESRGGEPVDDSPRGDQCGRLEVAHEPVVGDRGIPVHAPCLPVESGPRPLTIRHSRPGCAAHVRAVRPGRLSGLPNGAGAALLE